jgi:hypothetical protein
MRTEFFIITVFALLSLSKAGVSQNQISNQDIESDTVRANELNSSYFNCKNVKINSAKWSCRYGNKNQLNLCKILDSSGNKVMTTCNYYHAQYLDDKIGQDYIEIAGKKYLLDSLVKKNCKNCTLPIHGLLNTCFFVYAASKRYVAIFFYNSEINDNTGNLAAFLIQVYPDIHVTSLGTTIYNPKKLFFDSDTNGNLEYLTLSQSCDTIHLKKVINGDTKTVQNKFLIIHSSDGNGLVFTIDETKSVW